MDPNETLRQLRRLVTKVLHDFEDPDASSVDLDDAVALAETFNHLDEWISRGGFLPEVWAKRGRS